MPNCGLLPSIVTHRIISLAAAPHVCYIFTWKRTLPLLWICHSWRQVAVKVVYGVMLVDSARRTDVPVPSNSVLIDGAITSNIDLIIQTSNTLYTKKIVFAASCKFAFKAIVDGEHFRQYLSTGDWTSVTALVVDLTINRHGLSFMNSGISDADHLVPDFARLVIQAVPNVSNLKLPDNTLSAACTLFSQLVIVAYLDQLKYVECNSRHLENVASFTSQLTYIGIHIDEAGFIIPGFACQTVRHLKLCNASLEFSLSELAKGYEAYPTTFPNPRCLELGYSGHQSVQQGGENQVAILSVPVAESPHIIFPALSVLKLRNPNLLATYEMFTLRRYIWPSIQLLSITGDHMKLRRDSHSQILERHQLDNLVSHILLNMPTTARLNPVEDFSSLNANNQLTLASNQQDHSISRIFLPSMVFDFPHFSSDLTQLRVSIVNKIWYCIPGFHSATLQNLHLEDVPAGRFWSQLCNRLVSGTIVFGSLIKLCIEFDDSHITTELSDFQDFLNKRGVDRQVAVLCPKLTHFTVRNAYHSKFQSVLSHGGPAWESLKTLSIEFTYRAIGRCQHDETYFSARRQFMRALYSHVNQFSVLLPNVQKLYLKGLMVPETASHFYSYLASLYAGQLTDLHCDTHIAPVASSFSPNMRMLSMHMDPLSTRALPTLNPGNIVSLVLLGIPYSFSWSWLGFNSYRLCITFGHLKNMQIGFTYRDKPNTKHNDCASSYDIPTFYMPRLKSLHLDFPNYMHACKVFINIQRADVVSLRGSFSSIAFVGETTNFDVAYSLKVTIWPIEKSDEELFYRVTNRLFGGDLPSCNSSLSLPFIPFHLKPDSVTWGILTCLGIKHEDFTIVIQLLPRLTSLVGMTYVGMWSSHEPDISCLRNNDQESVKAREQLILSRTMRSLTFTDFAYQPPGNNITYACCAYILVLIPTLVSVRIRGSHDWGVKNIIDDFGELHPHIANLSKHEGPI